MGRLFKIIFGKEEIDYESLSRDLERDVQIRSIRRRIEKLRQNLYSPRPETLERTREISKPTQDMEKRQRAKTQTQSGY